MGAVLLATRPAAADASPDQRASAAAAFDEGVARFDHADYANAARAFLRADELAPSADAIKNAIAAARKANDHLLVVEAAERGIARAEANPDLATSAREALAQAARNLARIELRCEPLPCSFVFDGADASPGSRYVLPGTHSATATAPDGNRTEEGLSFIAGATYTVTLHAGKTGEATQKARISSTAGRAPISPTPDRRPPSAQESRKPLPPSVVFVGGAVTVLLGGATAWSGLDTLSARRHLSSTPSRADEDAVRSKILRSDLLLGGTVLATGFTVAAAFLWVDWPGGARLEAGAAPVPGGAMASAGGRF